MNRTIAKGFLTLTVLAAACLTAEAAKPATRLEGTYHAVYDCTYAPADGAAPSIDSLRAIESSLDMTATGVNFRRVFDAASTECRMNVTIDITKVEALDSEQAKAMRKADRKRFAGANK